MCIRLTIFCTRVPASGAATLRSRTCLTLNSRVLTFGVAILRISLPDIPGKHMGLLRWFITLRLLLPVSMLWISTNENSGLVRIHQWETRWRSPCHRCPNKQSKGVQIRCDIDTDRSNLRCDHFLKISALHCPNKTQHFILLLINI